MAAASHAWPAVTRPDIAASCCRAGLGAGWLGDHRGRQRLQLLVSAAALPLPVAAAPQAAGCGERRVQGLHSTLAAPTPAVQRLSAAPLHACPPHARPNRPLQCDCRHLYFIGVTFQWGSDNVFHCELCTNLLLKRCAAHAVAGLRCHTSKGPRAASRGPRCCAEGHTLHCPVPLLPATPPHSALPAALPCRSVTVLGICPDLAAWTPYPNGPGMPGECSVQVRLGGGRPVRACQPAAKTHAVQGILDRTGMISQGASWCS